MSNVHGREPGYYWVRDDGEWLIAEWRKGQWSSRNWYSCDDSWLDEIDERRIVRDPL